MLIIIIIVSMATVDCTLKRSDAPAEYAQNSLLNTLRRQLMENNYDYQSMEQSEQSAREQRGQREQRARPSARAASQYLATSPEGRFRVVETRPEGAEGADDEANKQLAEAPPYKGLEFKVHDKAVGLDVLSLRASNGGPHFRGALGKSFEEDKPSDVVSKNDLLYYVDENRLRRSQDQPGDERQPRRDTPLDYEELYPHDTGDTGDAGDAADAADLADAADADAVVTTPKVKYKLFKVRERSPTRRNAPVRRFLQERGADGVAFMSLDAAPFPLFKLPRSRRQYMRGSEDAEELRPDSEYDELPPPPAAPATSHQNNRDDI